VFQFNSVESRKGRQVCLNTKTFVTFLSLFEIIIVLLVIKFHEHIVWFSQSPVCLPGHTWSPVVIIHLDSLPVKGLNDHPASSSQSMQAKPAQTLKRRIFNEMRFVFREHGYTSNEDCAYII
jgi:hypothetical protein